MNVKSKPFMPRGNSELSKDFAELQTQCDSKKNSFSSIEDSKQEEVESRLNESQQKIQLQEMLDLCHSACPFEKGAWKKAPPAKLLPKCPF